MIEARQHVTILTTVEGLSPGDTVTVETSWDDDAPPAGRWQQFAAAYAAARLRRGLAAITSFNCEALFFPAQE